MTIDIQRAIQTLEWDEGDTLLLATLQVGVPLRIADLKKNGAPDREEIDRVSIAWREHWEHELLLYKEPGRKGETKKLCALLIDTLAVLAFQPGGVRFTDEHWEAMAPPRHKPTHWMRRHDTCVLTPLGKALRGIVGSRDWLAHSITSEACSQAQREQDAKSWAALGVFCQRLGAGDSPEAALLCADDPSTRRAQRKIRQAMGLWHADTLLTDIETIAYYEERVQ
jgi:hypothetical protein